MDRRANGLTRASTGIGTASGGDSKRMRVNVEVGGVNSSRKGSWTGGPGRLPRHTLVPGVASRVNPHV